MPRSFLAPLLVLLAVGADAARAGASFQPYFVSLRNSTTYMREGPSERHRIKWVYHHQGFPFEVIAAYDVWRRVRDKDGEIGWIHSALLSRDRTAVVTGEGLAALRRRPDPGAEVVAQAEPGAIGRLAACGIDYCELRFERASGWMERTRIWGVRDGEQF